MFKSNSVNKNLMIPTRTTKKNTDVVLSNLKKWLSLTISIKPSTLLERPVKKRRKALVNYQLVVSNLSIGNKKLE